MNNITVGSSMFYTIIACLVFMNCIMAEKYNKKLFVWFNILLLTFVAGFRGYSVGSDTYGYTIIFKNSYAGIEFSKDPMFAHVCRALMTIWNNPTFLFIVFGFIIYALISLRLWEIHGLVSFTYAFMMFFCFYFFQTMNGLRQFVAVAILFWGTRFLVQGKYIKYIITIFLAYVFHITALLGILAFVAELFNWKKLDKKQRRFIVLMIIVGIVSSSYAIQYMTKRTELYMHYFDTVVMNAGFRLIALVGIFILSLCFFNTKRYILNNNPEMRPGYFITATRIYYFLGIALGLVGYFFPFMERLGWCYALFQGVYFGALVKESDQLRRYLLKLPIILILLYVLINYLFFKNGSFHHPYVFIWNQ